MLRAAVMLDASMTADEAILRLAQHGYWIEPRHPSIEHWLERYAERIRNSAGTARVSADPAGQRPHPIADPSTITADEAASLLRRPLASGGVAIRQQDGVTIFWYSRTVADILPALTGHSVALVERVLNLRSPHASHTAAEAVLDLARAASFDGVVLRGHVPIAVGDGVDESFGPDRGGRARRDGAEIGARTGRIAVQAYPWLSAPRRVIVGERFDLEIGLTDTPMPDVRFSGPITLEADAGVTTISLDIQVIADGFDADTWKKQLDVLVDRPTEARVKFQLVARPQRETVRLTTIIVRYVRDGVARGVASRQLIVEQTANVAGQPDGRGQSWIDSEAPAVALDLDPRAAVPDIEIDIAKPDGNAASGKYACVIRNAHGITASTAPVGIDLGADAKTFAKQLIDDVSLWMDQSIVDNLMLGVGATIAGKLPAELWTMLTAVAAKVGSRAVTLQLNSAEPYVPWELAFMKTAIDPKRPPYLAAQVAMGRWILGDSAIACPPKRSHRVNAMAVLAGSYQSNGGLRPLPGAIDEMNALGERYGTLPAIKLPLTPVNVKSLLDATIVQDGDPIGGVDAVHLACHGRVDPTQPGNAAVYLSNGRALSPLFFANSKLGRLFAPVMFLNACMVGTAGELLGDFGGFPGACLSGGFSGLIAPLWAVDDDVAKSFALLFYQYVLAGDEGRSVGEALRDLRANYQSERPQASYLAYVYYGNPQLKLSTAPRPS